MWVSCLVFEFDFVGNGLLIWLLWIEMVFVVGFCVVFVFLLCVGLL